MKPTPKGSHLIQANRLSKIWGPPLFEGKHEPLISKALFDKVQEVAKATSRPKSRASKSYLYKAMFSCEECGCMITHEKQKGHIYLRCTKKKGPCSEPYLREETMKVQVREAVLSASLPGEDADWMLGELESRQDQARQVAEQAVSDIEKELDQINRREKRLQEAYLDEVVSLEEFRQSKTAWVSERRSLTERRTQIEKQDAVRLEPVGRFIKASKQAGLDARADDHEASRDWLQKLGSNRRVHHGLLVFELCCAWKLVATSRLLANNPERPQSVARGHSPELVGLHLEAERAGFADP